MPARFAALVDVLCDPTVDVDAFADRGNESVDSPARENVMRCVVLGIFSEPLISRRRGQLFGFCRLKTRDARG
jgi:hypothetical protein